LDALRKGSTKDSASSRAGIHKSTFFAWYNQGLNSIKDGVDDEYARFANDVDLACRMVISLAEECWINQFPDDWRACMAFLEKRDPDNYRTNTKIEIKQEVTHRRRVLALPDNGHRGLEEDDCDGDDE